MTLRKICKPEAYSELCQTSEMERFVNDIQPLTIIAKLNILYV